MSDSVRPFEFAIVARNPALLRAPFANSSFESADADGRAVNWSTFWSDAGADAMTDESTQTYGIRSLKLTNTTAANARAIVFSEAWDVAPGAEVLVDLDTKATGLSPELEVILASSPPTGEPNFFGAGVTLQTQVIVPTSPWERHNLTFTLPSDHTRARLLLAGGSALSSAITNVWVDGLNVAGGEINVLPRVGLATLTFAAGMTASVAVTFAQPFPDDLEYIVTANARGTDARTSLSSSAQTKDGFTLHGAFPINLTGPVVVGWHALPLA